MQNTVTVTNMADSSVFLGFMNWPGPLDLAGELIGGCF